MPDAPIITVDVGERVSGMPGRLESLGAEILVTRLAAGDYVLAEDCVVERKSVLDLHGSVMAGRFWAQIGALKAGCADPLLLVEGPALDRGPLHPNAVRGVCLAVAELGVAVLRTESRDDSARWLHLLARRRQGHRPRRDRPVYAQRARARRAEGVAEAMLAAVPGVSVVTARALLARFGSVCAVAEAEQSDLLDVPGIGPKRVEALRVALGPVSRPRAGRW